MAADVRGEIGRRPGEAAMSSACRSRGRAQLKFRDPERARRARRGARRLTTRDRPRARLGDARLRQPRAGDRAFGLRATFPAGSNVIMGPGCPVCITDMPEVDEGVALARQGVASRPTATCCGCPARCSRWPTPRPRAPRSTSSTASPRRSSSRGRPTRGRVLRDRLRDDRGRDRRGRAAAILPPNFSVLSAHKYIPPVMEIVAEMPETRVEGFLAAGHAATITGWGIFEAFVERHRIPVVVAGFEPLDILAGLVELVELDPRRRRRAS